MQEKQFVDIGKQTINKYIKSFSVVVHFMVQIWLDSNSFLLKFWPAQTFHQKSNQSHLFVRIIYVSL